MGANASRARRGNAALLGLKQSLQKLPTTVAVDVASRAAPALTDLSRGAQSSQRGVYGDSYPIGADGRQLTLRRTGAVARSLGFDSTGTVVRCVLSERYAKYLVGKYSILPNGPIPVDWRRRLDGIVADTEVAL